MLYKVIDSKISIINWNVEKSYTQNYFRFQSGKTKYIMVIFRCDKDTDAIYIKGLNVKVTFFQTFRNIVYIPKIKKETSTKMYTPF